MKFEKSVSSFGAGSASTNDFDASLKLLQDANSYCLNKLPQKILESEVTRRLDKDGFEIQEVNDFSMSGESSIYDSVQKAADLLSKRK